MRVALVVAGGTGERFGRTGGKQLADLGGEPVLARTLRAFDVAETIDAIVLVCHPDRLTECRVLADEVTAAGKVSAVVAGGETRVGSVRAGLHALPAGTAIVAVHDGARPLIEASVIDAAVSELERRPDLAGVVVGHPAFDTLKQVDADGYVVGTPARSSLWVAQTPQVFRVDALMRAHEVAASVNADATDDASLVERDGGRVLMLSGPRWNIKVTVPEDVDVVESILRRREEEGGARG